MSAERDCSAPNGPRGAELRRRLLDPPPFAWPAPVPIGRCGPRRRACCRGVVRKALAEYEPGLSYRAVLADDSGSLTLVFLGREEVPGIVSGAALEVEGMVGIARGELAMLNPRYRFTG